MDSIVVFANELEKLGETALPVVARNTINQTGLKLKQEKMPETAKKNFIHRVPNFFKANSRVEFAKGRDLKTMVTTVGFVSSGLHNSRTNYAVKNLEQQEHGGTIGSRSFKPLAGARRNGRGKVAARYTLEKIRLHPKNIVSADDSKGDKMQQFIKASVYAGKGGFVIGGRILWQVKNIKRKGRNIRFEKTKLYSFNKNGVAKVHATGFMEKSAVQMLPEMDRFFIENAKKEFVRRLGK